MSFSGTTKPCMYRYTVSYCVACSPCAGFLSRAKCRSLEEWTMRRAAATRAVSSAWFNSCAHGTRPQCTTYNKTTSYCIIYLPTLFSTPDPKTCNCVSYVDESGQTPNLTYYIQVLLIIITLFYTKRVINLILYIPT